MKVQPISVSPAKTYSTQVIKTTSTPIAKTKNGSDKFTHAKFELTSALSTLKGMKSPSNQNKPKFYESQIDLLGSILQKTPEKWDSIYALSAKNYIEGNTVCKVAYHPVEKLNLIKDYSDAKNKKDKPKYNNNDLILFSEVSAKALTNVKPLTQTELSAKNIILLAQTPDMPDMQKISEKIIKMEDSVGKNLKQIIFTKNEYSANDFVVSATDGKEITSELLDKNLNRQAIENKTFYKTTSGKAYQIKKVNDLRNNTTSKVRLEIGADNYPSVTHEIRIIKDKNNNVIKKEYTEPSEINGIFNIKHLYPNGETKIISEGRIDKKSGITTVKKDMTSLDGTKTEYLFEDDPQGNRIIDYKITDKNGKILLKNSQTFEIIDQNHFISAKNNEKYDIKVDKQGIYVQDMKNPSRKATLLIDKDIQGNKEKIMTSLKQMPGEELIKLAQSTGKLVGIDNELESFYQPTGKEIHSGDNLFVVLHELGHARDFKDVNVNNNYSIYKALFVNANLNKTFNEEKESFNKAFPDTQRDHIDYFINSVTHYGGKFGGLRETIAESNALLQTPLTHELLAIRSQYLQHYFPKTIAHLDNLLNK